MKLGDPYIVLRALGEPVPKHGELDPRTARDLMILDLLDRGEIQLPERGKALLTQRDQDRVWKEAARRRSEGETRVEVEGLLFEFAAARERARDPLHQRPGRSV